MIREVIVAYYYCEYYWSHDYKVVKMSDEASNTLRRVEHLLMRSLVLAYALGGPNRPADRDGLRSTLNEAWTLTRTALEPLPVPRCKLVPQSVRPPLWFWPAELLQIRGPAPSVG